MIRALHVNFSDSHTIYGDVLNSYTQFPPFFHILSGYGCLTHLFYYMEIISAEEENCVELFMKCNLELKQMRTNPVGSLCCWAVTFQNADRDRMLACPQHKMVPAHENNWWRGRNSKFWFPVSWLQWCSPAIDTAQEASVCLLKPSVILWIYRKRSSCDACHNYINSHFLSFDKGKMWLCDIALEFPLAFCNSHRISCKHVHLNSTSNKSNQNKHFAL